METREYLERVKGVKFYPDTKDIDLKELKGMSIKFISVHADYDSLKGYKKGKRFPYKSSGMSTGFG